MSQIQHYRIFSSPAPFGASSPKFGIEERAYFSDQTQVLATTGTSEMCAVKPPTTTYIPRLCTYFQITGFTPNRPR